MSWVPGTLALLVVLLLLVILLPAPGTVRGAGSGAPAVSGLPRVATTLTIGGDIGSHLDAPFQAVVLTTTGLGPNSARELGQFFNSTPITVFRLGGGLDEYDPITGIDYQPPADGGRYVAVADVIVNLTWFQSWCDSRVPTCEWIGSLPAEQNNTTLAVQYAQWYHSVLGFAPTYWQFGNEPIAWTHYGEDLSTWSTTDHSVPTGPGYAAMVKNYIQAISHLFPQDRYIGMEDNCACNPSMVADTTAQDGGQISAMAYHSYPWDQDSSTNLSQYLGALSGVRNITTTSAHMRMLDAEGCSTCGRIPIELGEYNAGPVPVHSPFSMQYPGAPFLAASWIQAIDANVSMFTVFELGWLYNSTSARVLPQGLLYQRILENVTMGQDFLVTVHAGGLGDVEALLIENGSREALLVVNANTTHALQLTLPTGVFPPDSFGSDWFWGPSFADPVATRDVALPISFTVGAEGILLVTNY
jgi:hypothetical protein